MQYVIDTNIFLRVLVKENEPTFQDCLAVLEAVKQKAIPAIVPGIVLSEVVWTLSSFYEFPKAQVIEAVQSILNLRGVIILDDYDYSLALDLYQNHTVKYTDAVIASLRLFQNPETQLISYDADFDKLAIKRTEPGKISLPKA
jgi:predicted nucleic acid-binding protein